MIIQSNTGFDIINSEIFDWKNVNMYTQKIRYK